MKFLSGIIVAMLIILFFYAASEKGAIRFVDRNDNTCGCIVDMEYPTMDQCSRLEGKLVESITVSRCE